MTASFAKTILAGEEIHLLPEKAIYWPAERVLFIADLHLGKIHHFRKHGMGVPLAAQRDNEQRLRLLLDSLDLREVIFLGDLFHSEHNDAWHLLERLTADYAELAFVLVEGNHDILADERYGSAGLRVEAEGWQRGPFYLTHEPTDPPEGLYTLCGHLHPGLRLRGRGRQVLRLPCFYFGERVGILPAFGVFTGLAILPAEDSDQAWAVADGRVVRM